MQLVFFKLLVEFRCIRLFRLEQLKIFLLRLYVVCGQCPPSGTDVDIERANEALQSGEMRLRRGRKDEGGTP
jgi:hypothetical protein